MSLSQILSFSVGEFNEWSDHAPIAFTFKCKNVEKVTRSTEWINAKRDDFRSLLISKLSELNRVTQNLFADNRKSINSAVICFVQVIQDTANPVFRKTVTENSRGRFRNTLKKPAEWVDKECFKVKRVYTRAVRKVRRHILFSLFLVYFSKCFTYYTSVTQEWIKYKTGTVLCHIYTQCLLLWQRKVEVTGARQNFLNLKYQIQFLSFKIIISELENVVKLNTGVRKTLSILTEYQVKSNTYMYYLHFQEILHLNEFIRLMS